MRVGVFIESLPDSHGGYQQAFSMTEALAKNTSLRHEIVVFTAHKQTQKRLQQHGIDAIHFRRGVFRLLDVWSTTVLGNAVLRRLRRLGFRRLGRHLDALLQDHRIALAVLNECTDSARRIGDHPLIVSVWDVDHRDHPEFPESFRDRVFERRERYLPITLIRAIGVIVSSESAAQRVHDLYRVDKERLIVLPFVPSVSVRKHADGEIFSSVNEVRRTYGLPEKYVFYPAAFLPQKNHLYLLEGLVECERRHGISLHAVFCGNDFGNREVVERHIARLGLTGRVKFLGFVPDEHLPALYQGAVALVMPTYCGPTNLPPLEATMLGCPAVYSDLPGCREQMGDGVLYCDLNDPRSVANHLANLVSNQEFRAKQIEAGLAFAAKAAIVDYPGVLGAVFDQYEYLRRRWTWPEEMI